MKEEFGASDSMIVWIMNGCLGASVVMLKERLRYIQVQGDPSTGLTRSIPLAYVTSVA